MDLRTVFINEYGRLRSGWRVLLFAVTLVAIYLLFGAALWIGYGFLHGILPPVPYGAFFADIVGRLSMLFAALLAGYLCTRLLEGLPWRALGLTLHRGWLRDLLLGSVVGVVSLTTAVIVATAAGALRFSVNSSVLRSVIPTLISTAILFIVAALAEEAIFRGYALQTLTRARLAWLGILLTSVPFATGHLWNPNVVPFVTFFNTALAGVWLAAAYLRTRSLWFPLGIHWAWNWALGSLFGLPVSGLKIVSHPLLQGSDLGPAWLTGGSYGIEGGAACTIALLISTLFIWRTSLISPTSELKQLTSEENPATPTSVVTIRAADTAV